MNKIKAFNLIMSKAKQNGYSGDDFRFNIGFIIDKNNICSLIFDSNFNSYLFSEQENKKNFLERLATSEDKWEFITNNLDKIY